MTRRWSRRSMLVLPFATVAGIALTGRSLLRAQDLPPAAGTNIIERPPEFAHGAHDGTRITGDALVATRAGSTFTSQAIALPARLTHIGVRWHVADLSLATPAAALQMSADGRAWGPWRTVRIETAPGATASDDYFGALQDARGARFVRYRLTFATGREAPVERVGLVLIDTGPVAQAQIKPEAPIATPTPTTTPTPSATASASASPSPTGTAVVAPQPIHVPGLASDWEWPPGSAPYDGESGLALGVVTREGWGADEWLRYDTDGREIWHEMFVPSRLIAVHHTASRNDYGPGESVNDVQAIYYYHADASGHGWGDIGYNALIDRYGVIYEGRHGRGGDPGDPMATREILSEALSAGHAKHHNYGSVGVALIGDSLAPGWDMWDTSGPRWEALVAYCTFEARRGFVRTLAPDGSAAHRDFLRSDNIWQIDAPVLGGHIDFEQTDCPGEPVINLLPALRQAIHDRTSGTSRTGVRIVSAEPAALEIAPGATLRVRWEPEAPEPGWSIVGFEYRFEAWFKPEDGDDLTYLAGYGPGPQPRPSWRSAPPQAREASFVVRDRGQHTFEVRALLRQGDRLERSAYVDLRSWLVL